MRVATFKEWIDAKARLVEIVEDEGEGDVYVRCPECGGNDCVFCCDGIIKIAVSEIGLLGITPDEYAFPFEQYEQELKQDIAALAEWTGHDYTGLMISAGFVCWCDLRTKTIAFGFIR